MDEVFEHPRLVPIYDTLEGARPDLEVYAAVAEALGARHDDRERGPGHRFAR
ncbi:hypothetical protein [Amycolatopsis alkalitolerans]|uniref:hypothetical protein n=1 Tax=Amycolatopsis alkalitolerans TaxID=2547244 RepID=UPI0026D2313B